MKGIRDWVFSQLLSNSLASSSHLSGGGSFFTNSSESVRVTHSEAPSLSPDAQCSSDTNQQDGTQTSSSSLVVDFNHTNHASNDKEMDKLAKIEDLQIKFFRLLRRFGQSPDNLLVAKVLYRLHLATLIRAGESDLKGIRSGRARALAAEQEASGIPKLNSSLKILVLGKTGVGKSATINSILDQSKTTTNAFQPSTKCIKEVVGTVNGVKVTFIDTPGLLPSSTSKLRRNRKILLSVRRFIKRSPPDMVLFLERLDLINKDYSGFPLMKLITDVFGTAIWFNTILVLTHASSTLPEGPSGYPVSYESYVTHCSQLMQNFVHLAVSDSKLENPVVLVENHPRCRKNFMGETVLPNGKVWKSQFFLLCICTKILCDANNILGFKGSIELGPLLGSRVPSLPHLLSSLLRHRSASSPDEMNYEIDEILLSELDEEDEYDQLPPIRILSKSQFEKLTESHKREYLDEVDYRETLYLKKQLKEEARKRRDKKLSKEEKLGEDDDSDEQQAPPEPVLLPDMAIPLSFDSDSTSHRYRCLVTDDQWFVRPVLDPQGWDHDVGFDGINLETAAEIRKDLYASVTGQMSKSKHDFSIHSESSAVYADPRGPICCVGLDVQSSGKDLIYTVHGNTKLRNIKHNVADCGVSLTSFGNKYYIGAKLEDTVFIGKQLKLVINAGQTRGGGQVAYGGSFEAVVRGSDYPVRNDSVSLSMTAISFKKEMVLGGGFQSEFRPIRGMTMAVNANLNTRQMGHVSIKMSSSEHTEIALVAIFSICKAFLRRIAANGNQNREALELG